METVARGGAHQAYAHYKRGALPNTNRIRGNQRTPYAQKRPTDEASASFRTLIFDLDGTLYPNDNGYVAHIRANAERYMHERLGIPLEQVGAVRKQALALANQTVRGLKMQGYEFDAQELTAYMRAGEEHFMKPDPEVQDFLASLSQPMWVFTNTGEVPAERALKLLGIDSYFEGVLGADFMGDICKPQQEAFAKALDHIGAEAQSSVMFEDSVKNVVACNQLGMATVFVTSEDPEQGVREVGANAQDVNALAEAVVSKCSLTELKAQMPALWL